MGDTFEVLATNTLADQSFIASPVIVDQAIYLRSRTHLFRIAGPGNAASRTAGRCPCAGLFRTFLTYTRPATRGGLRCAVPKSGNRLAYALLTEEAWPPASVFAVLSPPSARSS
jgi:hypothetical protein